MEDAKKKSKDYSNAIIIGLGAVALGIGFYSMCQRRRQMMRRHCMRKRIHDIIEMEGQLPNVLSGATITNRDYLIVPNVQFGSVSFSSFPTDVIPLAARRFGDMR